jgi:hypothetical protein
MGMMAWACLFELARATGGYSFFTNEIFGLVEIYAMRTAKFYFKIRVNNARTTRGIIRLKPNNVTVLGCGEESKTRSIKELRRTLMCELK